MKNSLGVISGKIIALKAFQVMRMQMLQQHFLSRNANKDSNHSYVEKCMKVMYSELLWAAGQYYFECIFFTPRWTEQFLAFLLLI